MEGVLITFTVIAALVIVDIFAVAFGIDSREGFSPLDKEIR